MTIMMPPAERTFGNQPLLAGNQALNIVCTGPEKSSNPRKTNART